MLKMSKQSDYALILMTILGKLSPNTYMGLKEISQEHNLPYKFIGQIATKLKNAKLITSKEGSGGGYMLNKSAQSISLHQIITAIEGPIAPTSCMRGLECRCQGSCQHQKIISNLASTLTQAMDNYSLADIVKNQ